MPDSSFKNDDILHHDDIVIAVPTVAVSPDPGTPDGDQQLVLDQEPSQLPPLWDV